MLSKGGKIEYACPGCGSINVGKVPHNTMLPVGNQVTGECFDCDSWWPWTSRQRISRKNVCATNGSSDVKDWVLKK